MLQNLNERTNHPGDSEWLDKYLRSIFKAGPIESVVDWLNINDTIDGDKESLKAVYSLDTNHDLTKIQGQVFFKNNGVGFTVRLNGRTEAVAPNTSYCVSRGSIGTIFQKAEEQGHTLDEVDGQEFTISGSTDSFFGA